MPRLLFAISAHGLGHLGQAAPVCNALIDQRPDLELSIWSALPIDTLRQRIHRPFRHIAQACDIGFDMHDALKVDIAASWQRYLTRNHHWAMHLEEACTIVRSCRPDLIVSDVGDMPLAAGQALDISTIAMSSLNWADMATAYFADFPDSAETLGRLAHLYDNATLALRLTPGMPMRGQREHILPPIGAVSDLTRQQIDDDLIKALPYPDQPRVLVGMGGIETMLPLYDWPCQSKINFIVANQKTLPMGGNPERGLVNADMLRKKYGWNFCDLLTGCDAVICKPGYGTFVEAALAGSPVLYVQRPDWPEQSVLVAWLEEHARCTELATADLSRGSFLNSVNGLLAQTAKSPIQRDGAAIAAREILQLLN